MLVLPEIGIGRWLENNTIDQVQEICALAKDSHVHIVTTLKIKKFNRWLWIGSDGNIRFHYDKIHLFAPLGEHKHYHAGSQVVVDDPGIGWQVGAAVCFDLRFASLFTNMRNREAELLIIPARWPAVRLHHWQSLLRARAIEFQCWVVGVNAIGPDPFQSKLVYGGGSMIIDPTGEIVVQMDHNAGIADAVVELSVLKEHRSQFPVWDSWQKL